MKLTKKREEEILSLCNALAEQMPMGKYTRQQLLAAITFWQDDACDLAGKLACLRSDAVCAAAVSLLERLHLHKSYKKCWLELVHKLKEMGDVHERKRSIRAGDGGGKGTQRGGRAGKGRTLKAAR